MSYQKFTMIDDLPELEQISKSEQPVEDERTKRFIRNSQSISQLPEESGMSQPRYEQQPVAISSPPVYQNEVLMEPMTQHYISCRDVYMHIETCPICKRFYKQDNTVYLVVIGILIILCILLIKKVLSI